MSTAPLTASDITPDQRLCRRCGARGYGSWRPSMGQCFGCDGRGWVWKDKFREAYRQDFEQPFFGSTFAHQCGDQLLVEKLIHPARSMRENGHVDAEFDAGVLWGLDYVAVRISVDQARAFFQAHTDGRARVLTIPWEPFRELRFAAIRARAPFDLIRAVIAAHPSVVRLPSVE